MKERLGLVLGKNYVETLILTFEQFLLLSPEDLDMQEYVVLRMEEVLCSLSMYMPYIRNSYHKKIKELISENFPRIPYTNPETCFVYQKLIEWSMNNAQRIMGTVGDIIPARNAEKQLRKMIIRITRTAILATLMEVGVIHVKS